MPRRDCATIRSAQPVETAARRFLRFGRALSQQENETGWHVAFWGFFLAFLPKNERCILPVQSTWLPDYPSTDYKIIQMLTARLSRVSLQRYPDTDYTIRLTTTGDNPPSRSSSLFIFWQDDKLPRHCHLDSNSSVSLILYQGSKRPSNFVIGANERDTCGSRSTLIGPKGVERLGSLSSRYPQAFNGWKSW